MPVEVIKCSMCGFEVDHVYFSGRGKMSINVAEWIAVCKKTESGQPFNCPHLKAEIERPRRPRS